MRRWKGRVVYGGQNVKIDVSLRLRRRVRRLAGMRRLPISFLLDDLLGDPATWHETAARMRAAERARLALPPN